MLICKQYIDYQMAPGVGGSIVQAARIDCLKPLDHLTI